MNIHVTWSELFCESISLGLDLYALFGLCLRMTCLRLCR